MSVYLVINPATKFEIGCGESLQGAEQIAKEYAEKYNKPVEVWRLCRKYRPSTVINEEIFGDE